MIDLTQPPIHAAGLMMFAYDQRPPVWHVVPERPSLEMLPDGKPALLLIKYRVDPSRGDWPRGGGLLRLQCNLRVSDQALAQARTVLIAQSGGTLQNIVPLRAERVTCEFLVGMGELAAASAVTATPSSEPPFGASFEVPLSMPAVTVFEEALKGALSPGAIRYSLTFKGRRPQLPAKVTIDWVKMSLLVYVRAPTINEHVARGHIRIEITDPGAGTGVLERVMEEVAHIMAGQPAGRLLGPTVHNLSRPREEERVITPSAALKDLLGELGPGLRPESLVARMEEVSHG